MGNPSMFAQNVFLLLGLLVFLGVAFVLIILSWTGLRAWWWQRSVNRATRAWRARRFRPDGIPFPPSGPGICQNCQTASKKVYYLSTGERLCPACFLDLGDVVGYPTVGESPVK